MAKSKTRKVAPKKNRVAIKDPKQKGGVRMINADASGRPLPTQKQDRDPVVKSTEPRVLTQTERSTQTDLEDIGSLAPRAEEGPTANKKRVERRSTQQRQITEGSVSSGPGSKKDISPVRFGVTAEAIATSVDSGGGTRPGDRPSVSLDEADGAIRKVRKSSAKRGSFGAPDSVGAGDAVVKRTGAAVRRSRKRAANRSVPGRTGAMQYNDMSDINIAESRDAQTQEGITSLRAGITSQNLATKRPVEKMTASERHIHFASQARAADVAAATANITSRQFRRESVAGRKAYRDDVAAAVAGGHITKDDAADLRSDKKYGYRPGNPATLADTRAALNQTKGGLPKKRGTAKIEHEDAMHISPAYAAEETTPSLDKYMMSDAAMHHEVGHYLNVRPSTIKSFVSKIPVGPGKARRPDSPAPATPAEGNFSSAPMKEFRDKIVNAVRGEGMQTSWVPTGAASGPAWKPVNWHPKGAIRVRSRQADGSNMTVTKNVRSQAPEGSISHLDYIKLQLANHQESSPSAKSTTRKREFNPTTQPIVTAAMASGAPTPPKGRGGSYISNTVGSETDGTVVKPEKFTPARRPRRRAE